MPEQEIADALLAASADEKVRLRRVGHAQEGRKVGFANPVRDLREHRLGFEHCLERIEQIPPPAVIGGNREPKPGVAGSEILDRCDQTLKLRFKSGNIADHPQPYLIFVQAVGLAFKQ